jgi:hypothetical protein
MILSDALLGAILQNFDMHEKMIPTKLKMLSTIKYKLPMRWKIMGLKFWQACDWGGDQILENGQKCCQLLNRI